MANGTEFDRRSQRFLDWFRTQEGTSFHADLEIKDLRHRDAGRSIFAIRDLPADAELFTIPRATVLSVETSDLATKAPGILTTIDAAGKSVPIPNESTYIEDDEIAGLPNSWLDLILVLIYEYLQGEKTRWKPYFDVLPREFDSLMFWSDEELQCLQASAVKSKIGKESAEELFRTRVIPAVNSHASVFYAHDGKHLSDEELIALSHRMGSIIMAYAFDLENEKDSEDEEQDGWAEDREGMMQMGMVPTADLLNADAEFNAHLNHGEDRLTMTSTRPIKAGEEVLNYYGPLPNCDLLRRYGYTSDKHARYDVVEVDRHLFKDCVTKHFNVTTDRLDEIEGCTRQEEDDSFVIERDAGEPDETGVNRSDAKVLSLPEELEEQVSELIAPLMKIDISRGRPSKEDRKRLKATFLQISAKMLEEREAQYATSAEEDRQILRNDKALARRHKMAIEVRLGEKMLLREAKQFVMSLLEEKYDVRLNGGSDTGPPTKKQKVG